MKEVAAEITKNAHLPPAEKEAMRIADSFAVYKMYTPDVLESEVQRAINVGRKKAETSLPGAVLYFMTLAVAAKKMGMSEIPFYREMRKFTSIEDGSILSNGSAETNDILEAIKMYKIRVFASSSNRINQEMQMGRLGAAFEMLADREPYQAMDLIFKFEEDIRPLRRDDLSQTVLLWAIKQVGFFVIAGTNVPHASRQMNEIRKRLLLVEPTVVEPGYKNHRDAVAAWCNVVSAWHKKDPESAVECLQRVIETQPDSFETLKMVNALLSELTLPDRKELKTGGEKPREPPQRELEH